MFLYVFVSGRLRKSQASIPSKYFCLKTVLTFSNTILFQKEWSGERTVLPLWFSDSMPTWISTIPVRGLRYCHCLQIAAERFIQRDSASHLEVFQIVFNMTHN
ncbi:hypothetical protein CEXT_390871 [Caerostris extrusa]|uniref:Uncharacterized protein n=1 Tax=Caerostris extrusa TaxID=172846 RepID=A0AAV4VX26_CAEEX|nr:hypothetical protein CEXT_390871 [Caerostris extrusa]